MSVRREFLEKALASVRKSNAFCKEGKDFQSRVWLLAAIGWLRRFNGEAA